MGRINWSRVILGGLLAGLVLNVVDYIYYGVVMKQDMAAAMQALGKQPIPDSIIWVFVVWDFVMGIGLVWLYAAIRPRFGAGVKTAGIAGGMSPSRPKRRASIQRAPCSHNKE